MLTASLEGNNDTQDLLFIILFHFVILNKFPEMARVQSGCYYYCPADYTASNSGLLCGWTFLLLNTYLMCLVLAGPLDTNNTDAGIGK